MHAGSILRDCRRLGHPDPRPRFSTAGSAMRQTFPGPWYLGLLGTHRKSMRQDLETQVALREESRTRVDRDGRGGCEIPGPWS